MTDVEAIALVTRLLKRDKLGSVQELVFKQSWAGNKYSDIFGYDLGYIKDVGSELWRSLSQALNEKVTKNNVRGVLERYAQQQAALNANSVMAQIHMGEAIDVSKFCGRNQELETLREWILGDHCRVVTISRGLSPFSKNLTGWVMGCGVSTKSPDSVSFSTMVALSFWAKHPPTAICMPGRSRFA
jgi:hypothetical protein